MTANVLAQGNDAALETAERRGMNRARLDVEFLMHWQVLHGSHNLLRRELLPLLDNGRRTHGFCDLIKARQSASCRARNMPPSLLQTISFWFAEPHPQFDTVIEKYNVKGLDINSRVDDALVTT